VLVKNASWIGWWIAGGLLALLVYGCSAPPKPVTIVEPIDYSKRPRVIDSPEGARIVFPAGILFEFNQAILSREAGTHFDDCQFIYEKARGKIIVEGHTDSRGTPQSNQVLSESRARAVMQELVKRKIAASRISLRPLAFRKPVVPNAKTDEEHAQNRRAEMILENETVASLQAEHGCGTPPESKVVPAEPAKKGR
jgi:outer membrane protein OmpA-like peptidoglycan-associated protein